VKDYDLRPKRSYTLRGAGAKNTTPHIGKYGGYGLQTININEKYA
jgi:hypothetical protein